MKKTNLPEKICLVCERPFKWRKKWEKCWEEVKYCGEKCRRNKRRTQEKRVQKEGFEPQKT